MTSVTGVNVTVDPVVCARHGLGGWMLISAWLGNASRLGGPGGVRISSMFDDAPGGVDAGPGVSGSAGALAGR